MPRTLVVTDSTAYLPEGWAAELGVTLVPVQVIINGRSFDETDSSQALDVVDALIAMQPVTTSRPSPQRFTDVFESASAAGFEHIVVVTLSAALSGTFESATLAAQGSAVPVTVVDSQQIAMGMGWKVLAAVRCRDAGGSPEEITAAVVGTEVHTYFSVHTLEYLRRGGRVGSLSARLGAALHVKPILTLVDGRVEALEKVRTDARAMQRLEELAVAAATGPEIEIAVQHIGAPDRARTLAEALRSRLPQARIVECSVGGVIGAHTGPGMVAVVIH